MMKPIWRRESLLNAAIVLLFIAAAAVRVLAIPRSNIDMTIIERWYDFIVEHGTARALSDVYSNYPPAYLYILILATFTRSFLPRIVALKLIPVLFDVFGAFVVYKLVRLQYPSGRLPCLAAALFLVLPTVVMNGALWGQIDMLYASFLLLCLYFVLKDRPAAAMLAFSMAFSFKGQAIFFLPFLAVLTLKKRIPVWTFGLVPAVYILLALPTVIAGRDFIEVLTLYFSRVELFPALAMHAANLYSLVPGRFTEPAFYGGLVAGPLFILAWTLYYGFRKFRVTSRTLLLTALLSAVIAPFVLPKMHDRFFFPADLTSLVLAFFWPGFWYAAAGYQVISGMVYFIFLHSVTNEQNRLILTAAVILNTLMVGHLLIRQFLITRDQGEADRESKAQDAGLR